MNVIRCDKCKRIYTRYYYKEHIKSYKHRQVKKITNEFKVIHTDIIINF